MINYDKCNCKLYYEEETSEMSMFKLEASATAIALSKVRNGLPEIGWRFSADRHSLVLLVMSLKYLFYF